MILFNCHIIKLFSRPRQEICWDLEEMLAFFRTWSGYNTFMRKNPESDILERLKEDMKGILGEKSGEIFQFLTRYFLVLMRRE